MPIYNLATITSGASLRAVTESTDSHFFDADTMRYFNSRLLGDVFPLDGWETREGARFLFITSERFEDDPRQYSVRMLTLISVRDDRPAVQIDSDFDARHDTAAQARKAARERVALILSNEKGV